MHRTVLSFVAAALLSLGFAYAQDETANTLTDEPDSTAYPDYEDTPNNPPTIEELGETVNGLGERATLLEVAVEKLNAIKISGYVQAEWQHFDQTANAGRAVYSDARRNFFTVRRGRIKFQHKLGELMSYTIQPDITESGVTIKDAFLTFNILPMEELALNVGMFNRPTFEVELSSSSRESAERSQVVRAFYPGERDLGLMFTTRHTLFENFDPKLQVGVFNGVGTAPETDQHKDIIARLTFPLPLGGESPVQVDLGGSIYYGGIPQTDTVIIETVDGANKTVPNTETGDMRGWGNRSNWNVESQIYLDVLPFGGTIIRGEVMMGRRPTALTAGVARDSVRFVPAVSYRPLQIRNQMGYYIYFVQNIETWLQLVAKYDAYDRNTDLSGTQVASTSDGATSVLGLGANFFIDNIRITAWYEMPQYAAGENIQSGGGQILQDLRDTDLKDNKTTIRFQYKF